MVTCYIFRCLYSDFSFWRDESCILLQHAHHVIRRTFMRTRCVFQRSTKKTFDLLHEKHLHFSFSLHFVYFNYFLFVCLGIASTIKLFENDFENTMKQNKLENTFTLFGMAGNKHETHNHTNHTYTHLYTLTRTYIHTHIHTYTTHTHIHVLKNFYFIY